MASINEAFNLPLTEKIESQIFSKDIFPLRGSYKTYVQDTDTYKRVTKESDLKFYQLKEQSKQR